MTSRRLLPAILLMLIAASTAGCRAMIQWWITPAPFDAHAPPPAPDYTNLASWAAHPEVSDAADLVPPGSDAMDRQAEAQVDVFFVHPTTYYKREHFNAPWNDPDAAEITDTGVMGIQASSFNGAGRIFAPYYRQLALGGYLTADGAKGLEFAYQDVERAFDHWLAEWSGSRPFILASHSQGSRHAQTLLRRRFSGEEGRALRHRLVAAYLIGGWIPEAKLGGELPLPACEAADETGCLIGWRTVSADAQVRPAFDELVSPETNLCVNPLSWTRSDFRAPASAHLGALPLGQNDRKALPPVTVAMLGARCSEGQLKIDPTPEGEGWDVLVRKGNFHVYDYALFTMNIRANAQQRVAAYLARDAGR